MLFRKRRPVFLENEEGKQGKDYCHCEHANL